MSWTPKFLMPPVGWIDDTLPNKPIGDYIGVVRHSLLNTVTVWQIEDKHWQQFAVAAVAENLRWAAGWAEQLEDQFIVNSCFEKQGVYVLLRTAINATKPAVPSQAKV